MLVPGFSVPFPVDPAQVEAAVAFWHRETEPLESLYEVSLESLRMGVEAWNALLLRCPSDLFRHRMPDMTCHEYDDLGIDRYRSEAALSSGDVVSDLDPDVLRRAVHEVEPLARIATYEQGDVRSMHFAFFFLCGLRPEFLGPDPGGYRDLLAMLRVEQDAADRDGCGPPRSASTSPGRSWYWQLRRQVGGHVLILCRTLDDCWPPVEYLAPIGYNRRSEDISMPVAVALPALLSLAAAYLVEGRRPEMPAGGAEGGLDDADLWVRIDNGGDVLSGMMFSEAVNNDPRRVDALIQQRVLKEFYRALGMKLRGEAYTALAQHMYLQRMADLREAHEGKITARALADDHFEDWEEKSALILAVWQMRQNEADLIREAIKENRNEIYRALREAEQLAIWASKLAVKSEDKAAWSALVGVFENMRDFVQRGMELLGIELQIPEGEISLESLIPEYALPEKEEVRGMDPADYSYWNRGEFSTDFDSFRPASQRGAGISRAQWRHAGGRHY